MWSSLFSWPTSVWKLGFEAQILARLLKRVLALSSPVSIIFLEDWESYPV